MRVNGDTFFFINWFMDFLCLRFAACLLKARLRFARGMAFSLLGAGLAVLAWMGPKELRGGFSIFLASVLITLGAFGRACLRFPLALLPAGLLFWGAWDFLLGFGIAKPVILFLCAGLTLAMERRLRLPRLRERENVKLLITWKGKTAALPAFLDTGNFLVDTVSGLPVIVAPEEKIKPLMPSGVDTRDFGTLPLGFRLIQTKTAAGEKTLMCFTPDRVEIVQSGKTKKVLAAAAISASLTGRALLPQALFDYDQGEGIQCRYLT